MATPSIAQLTAALTALQLPSPTPAFLTPILTPSGASSRLPPLPALAATAKHRLLSSSISSTPSPLLPTNASFPATLSHVAVAAATLPADTFVQVLDVQDVGRSRWEQVQALESERKGETVKGREVIRVVPLEPQQQQEAGATPATQRPTQGAHATASPDAKGPFKLLLQDWKGNTAWGFELRKVERVALPPAMSIGCKMLLRRGTKVARGTILLEPATVMVFGGKIESLDKAWREGREQRLRDEVEAQRAEQDN